MTVDISQAIKETWGEQTKVLSIHPEAGPGFSKPQRVYIPTNEGALWLIDHTEYINLIADRNLARKLAKVLEDHHQSNEELLEETQRLL